MKVSITNPTGRKTEAHLVTINEHEFYFSYETCIAYRGPAINDVGMRLKNTWGPTTGRHINEMGLREWRVVTEEEFDHILSKI